MYNNYMNMMFDNQMPIPREVEKNPRNSKPGYQKVGDIFLYVVQPGDNLYQLAKMFQTQPEIILCFNQLDMACKIQPGQELLVPVVYDCINNNRNGYGLYF
ncbi:LysM peptidoglycan-binding domain-containing protein [Tannockella kyphosi]|uniref:LysM peptidoglycan-binding domain-containing protein n=1 Tax=Tannockella kyphosi TaxID=2899121 RepID=UPI00201329D7|nr:LysM peptidoglycan-binding domain-containing protein [Tannockella kyphosi]